MDALHLTPIPPWVVAHVGPAVCLDVRGAAMRIRPEGADPLWIKRLRPGRAWAQAERAHREVVPRLAEAGIAVPRCLHRWPEHRALLLTEVVGRSGRMTDPVDTFRGAATVATRLHAIPCPDGDVALSEAVHQRAAATAAHRAAPPALAARVAEIVATDAAAVVGRRVWCHRDFRPENWIVAPGHPGQIGLVDFEHTRPDHPLVDWVRLEAHGWTAPQRQAFAGVFGEPDPRALRCLLAVYGLATLVWARQHRDPALGGIGRRALALAGVAVGGVPIVVPPTG